MTYNLKTGYAVRVLTGTDSGAGTDSNITLTLLGEKGTILGVHLDKYMWGNAFENGQIDFATLDRTIRPEEAELDIPNVGDIFAICISSDGKWAGAAWLLSKIDVTRVNKGSLSNSKTARFDFSHLWITGNETTKTSNMVDRNTWKTMLYVSEEVVAGESQKIKIPFSLAPGATMDEKVNASVSGTFSNSLLVAYELDRAGMQAFVNQKDFSKKVEVLDRSARINVNVSYWNYLSYDQKFSAYPIIADLIRASVSHPASAQISRTNTSRSKVDNFNVVFTPVLRKVLILCDSLCYTFTIPVGLKYEKMDPPSPPTND